MSITSDTYAWRKAQAEREAKNSGLVDRFPTHTRVVLPDGDIMLVRVASLAAAKDLLAAQRAVERKLAAHREARMISEIAEIVDAAEQTGKPLDGAR